MITIWQCGHQLVSQFISYSLFIQYCNVAMFAIIYLKTILHQWGLLLKDIQHDEDKRVARCIVVRAPKKVRTFDWLLNNCDKIW